jgi:hypothetical protein
MTTITIRINERNKAGKEFLAYVKSQEGVEIIKEKKPSTPKPDKKKLMEIADKIKRNATKRMLKLHNIQL